MAPRIELILNHLQYFVESLLPKREKSVSIVY